MPSPPLVPTQCAIDVSYLRRMTLGDVELEREVLGLFKSQTGNLIHDLAACPSNAAELAHTLKGSARAVGAFDVGEAALSVENALRSQSDFNSAFQQLKTAVSEVFAAIDIVLAENN
jgi:HPt (histidine-containing phosphotransfer) domain-containing protein